MQTILKKTVSVFTSVATLVSLSGAVFLAPIATHAAVPSDYGLTEGNTISATGSSDPDVYIVNAMGYKRLFLNPVIFNFYGHLGGFAKVKSVSAAARDAFPTSGLFRNCETNSQQVWAVEVTGEDTGTLHKVTMSGDAAVAQDANFFKKVFCINNNEANWYSKSTVDYTSLSQVPVYSRIPGSTATPSPVANGMLSASLAPDSPAAGTVIAGQGVAGLIHVRLTNGMSSPVAVNSLTFQKIGVAGDSTFANVYVFGMTPGASLYGTRLTDGNTPSNGVVNFTGGTSTNNITTVPAYGYVDLALRSDILSGTQGQTVGMMLTSVNGSAVSGVSGNIFTVAAAPSDLSTAQFAAAASVLPATGTTDPLKDTVVWQDTVTISNKNELLRRFALRQTNSINAADVSNFRLFVDGVQVAQTQNLDANNYVTLVPATPVTVLTGSRTIKVLADITGGTSRKLTMSLRSAADVGLVDVNYGTNVTATLASGTFPLNAGDLSINSGSIVVQKDSTSPSGNIVKSSSDAVLGRWTFTSYGEPVKVSTLIAGLRLTGGNGGYVDGTSSLRNGRIMAYPVGNPAAAQQFGSTTSLKYSTTASTSYTTNLTVNPGQPMTVEVRGDIYDNGDASDRTQAADTIAATLYPGSSNGQGMVSLTTSAVPSATNATNTLTIQSGTLSISKYANFPDQTVTTPRSNTKIGDFIITGSTNEAVNVNTLTLGVTVGGVAAIGDLSNVYLKYNGVATSVKSTISATGNTYSLSNTVLPVNGSVHVEVFADISNRSSGTYQSTMIASGTTVLSSLAVNTNSNSAFSGQTMTIGSGTIASALDAGNPVAKNVTAQSTVDVAKFNFLATNDSFNITEIQLKTGASSSEQGIMNVILKKADGTILGTLPLSTSGASQLVTFGISAGTLVVPANDPNGLTLTAAVQSGTVGVNAATTGLNVALSLKYFKNTNSSGTLATDTTVRAGNAQYLYNSLPVISAVTLPSTLLSNGTQTLAKFSIVSTGASNATTGWNTILLKVAKTSGPNIASSGMQLFEDGVDVSSNVHFNTGQIGAGQTSGFIDIRVTNAAAEFQIPTTGHTYELKANVTSTVANDSINVSFNSPSTTRNVPTTASTAQFQNSTSASYVWTDRTGRNHSATSVDWENDYLIKNLPFTQSLSR